jgi:HlyD family secretion protein
VRVATAQQGRLQSTIRLTGVTAAENYSQLITPILRGSRSGSNRAPASAVTALTSLNVQARSGGNTSPAAGSSSNLSGALKASTSRVGGGTATTTLSATPTNSPSSTMGGEGIGTSAADLVARSSGGGGGGGGGGMSDFMLVLQHLVKPGAQVKKGDVIAEFDRQYMLTRVDDYKASVVQTEASMKRNLANLAVTRKGKEQQLLAAKGAYEKAKLDMKTLPVLSAMDVERTRLALEEAEAKYKQLESEIKYLDISDQAQVKISELDLAQSRSEYKRSETNADRLLVKTPIDGITVMLTTWRGADIGQVQEGDQLYSGQAFVSIIDPRSMVVNATVNQADAERLRIGQRAMVHFDAYPDLALPARVFSLGGIPKSSGVRFDWIKEIPVRLKLEQIDNRVLPDLSVAADVTITTSDEGAVIIPASSVQSSNGSSFVMVKASDGQWERRVIETGIANNTHIMVRSGLKPGEQVAEEPVLAWAAK